jgi:hypothetical protein
MSSDLIRTSRNIYLRYPSAKARCICAEQTN